MPLRDLAGGGKPNMSVFSYYMLHFFSPILYCITIEIYSGPISPEQPHSNCNRVYRVVLKCSDLFNVFASISKSNTLRYFIAGRSGSGVIWALSVMPSARGLRGGVTEVDRTELGRTSHLQQSGHS
jgi:hypothetical protein